VHQIGRVPRTNSVKEKENSYHNMLFNKVGGKMQTCRPDLQTGKGLELVFGFMLRVRVRVRVTVRAD